MKRWAGVVGLGLACAVAGPAAHADACSCGPGEELVRPQSGEAHPSNAALLLEAFCGGSPAPYAATIDGAPATLAAVDPPFEGPMRVNLDPPPAPGQEVVVTYCVDEFGFAHACTEDETPVEVVRYVAAQPDGAPPPAPGAGELVHEHGTFELGCSTADLRFMATIDDLDQGDETDVLYTIELQSPDGEVAQSYVEHVDAPTSTLEAEFLLSAERITTPAEDHCLVVRASDLAGNEAEVSRTCGSDDLAASCSCRSDTSPPPAWLFILLAVATRGRRRERTAGS